MPNDQDDFGPIFVTPAQVQSWLSRLSGKRTPEAAPAGDEEAAPLRAAAAAPPRVERMSESAPRRGLPRLRKYSIVATLVLALAVWGVSGFYKVQPDQVGLVLHFGRWIDTTGPGLN